MKEDLVLTFVSREHWECYWCYYMTFLSSCVIITLPSVMSSLPIVFKWGTLSSVPSHETWDYQTPSHPAWRFVFPQVTCVVQLPFCVGWNVTWHCPCSPYCVQLWEHHTRELEKGKPYLSASYLYHSNFFTQGSKRIHQVKKPCHFLIRTTKQTTGTPWVIPLVDGHQISFQISTDPGSQYNVSLINALVLFVGTQAIAYIHSKGSTPSASTIAYTAHMDIFQHLLVDLDTEGEYWTTVR